MSPRRVTASSRCRATLSRADPTDVWARKKPGGGTPKIIRVSHPRIDAGLGTAPSARIVVQIRPAWKRRYSVAWERTNCQWTASVPTALATALLGTSANGAFAGAKSVAAAVSPRRGHVSSRGEASSAASVQDAMMAAASRGEKPSVGTRMAAAGSAAAAAPPRRSR